MANPWAFAFHSLAIWTTDFGHRPSRSHLICPGIVIGPVSFHQLSKSSSVFQVNLCEGDGGAGLPVDTPAWPSPGECSWEIPAYSTEQTGRQAARWGSTSCAVTTSSIFLFLTKGVTVLTPTKTGGLLVGIFPLPAAFFSALAHNLCYFSCSVSCLDLWARLNS